MHATKYWKVCKWVLGMGGGDFMAVTIFFYGRIMVA